MKLKLAWLYPSLMDTYGDRGNILCLQKRAEWRGIDLKVEHVAQGTFLDRGIDLIFMGGAQDREQRLVIDDLRKEKSEFLKSFHEEGGVGLFVCAGFQLLGNYYQPAEGKEVEGLGIFDMKTLHPGKNKKRLIGNTVVEILDPLREDMDSETKTLVGFENHGGRTYLGKGIKPLGKVVRGFGNNEETMVEGAQHKNFLGSYFHGPILPKNPHLADYLLKKAVVNKDENFKFDSLDDSLEWLAHDKALKL